MIEQVRSYCFSIKQIFKEHWENYLSQRENSLCQDVIWTVKKMLVQNILISISLFLTPAKLVSVIPVVKFELLNELRE